MSIVIAKKELRTILFLSDTKVSIDIGDKTTTGNNKIRFDPLQGILKTYILFNGVCISFTGIVQNACLIMKEFMVKRPTSIPEFFQQALTNLLDNNTEFLIGLGGINETFLFKVNSQTIEKVENAWSGDINAFNEYQTFYHDKTEQIDNKFTLAQRAFENLITYNSVPTIGDFIIEAVYEVDYSTFIYCDRLMSFRGGRVINLQKDEKITLDEGEIADGSYQVTNLISTIVSKPAVAIFFEQANFGLLFIPNDCLEREGRGELFTNIDIDSFKTIVKDKYNIELFGFHFKEGTFTRR